MVERPRRLAGKFVAELRLQALRGELDRRERILDLVSESAGDLAPAVARCAAISCVTSSNTTT